MKRIIFFIPIILLFQNCTAQDLIISAYLGKNFPLNTYLKISQDINETFLRFENIKLTDRSFQFPLYYGIKISQSLKFINPKVFAEIEFIHSKVYSDPEQKVKAVGIYRNSLVDSVIRFGDIVQNFSISHGLNYLTVNFGYKFGDKISPFVKFGVGISIPHFETTIDSLSFERYETNDFVVQFASGFNIKIHKHILFFFEGKYTFGEIINAGIYGGTAETLMKMYHFVFGLGYTI